jgi:hypothetical protein
MLQSHSLQKLHRDEGLPLLIANVINCADVRMIQCGRRLSLALKTGECLRVAGKILGQELKRNKTMQPRVLSFINHAHPAATELLNDAVERDSLADHAWQILRGCIVLVNQSREGGTGATTPITVQSGAIEDPHATRRVFPPSLPPSRQSKQKLAALLLRQPHRSQQLTSAPE